MAVVITSNDHGAWSQCLLSFTSRKKKPNESQNRTPLPRSPDFALDDDALARPEVHETSPAAEAERNKHHTRAGVVNGHPLTSKGLSIDTP